MSKLVTQAEFARMCGVNRCTVHKWIGAGRIQTEPSGLIDPEAAMRMRESTESKLPIHQARKAQLEQIRGLTKEEIDEFYRRIREQKESAKEQKRLAMLALREQKRAAAKDRAIEAKKLWRKKDEVKEQNRKYQKRIADNLEDAYIVKILNKRYATPEMINMKRQQLLVARALRQLNSTLKEKRNEQD